MAPFSLFLVAIESRFFDHAEAINISLLEYLSLFSVATQDHIQYTKTTLVLLSFFLVKKNI